MQNNEIKVHVVDYGRKCLYMRYADPVTGKHVAKSTGTSKRKDAVKAAGKWEAELRSGKYKPPSRATWAEFWTRYEEEVLPGMSPATADKAAAVRSVAEKTMAPERMADLTPSWFTTFCAKLRDRKLTEQTIEGYVRYLSAAITYAVQWGMLAERPKIGFKRLGKAGKNKAKGRHLTTEEFERMLASVPSVVLGKRGLGVRNGADPDAVVASWRHFLRGLWLSGLRLEESLELWWDRNDRLRVDLSGRRPMLWIPGARQKSGQDQHLPITPDFAEYLQNVPPERRRGRVFNPARRSRSGGRLVRDSVTHVIGQIGRKANVAVWTHPRTGTVKYASAHDLRRSFGFRWATRVMPMVLQRLMRHESLNTTMAYYVQVNAAATADAVWESWKGNTLGNTEAETCEITAEL